jgi:Na+:H+ antiporter, NhaA family
MTGIPRRTPSLFGALRVEARRIADILRKETVGGALLLAGAALAMGSANSHGRAATSRCAATRSARRRCTSGPGDLGR